MRLKLKKLGFRGDTIVEVLIVVGVIGFVLLISYGVATRTQRYNRQAEERSQALKIAESQLENLRAYGNTSNLPLRFCFDTNGSVVILPNEVQAANAADEPFDVYPPECTRPPVGRDCSTYCYHLSVVKGPDNLYTVAVRWDGPTGNRDQVMLRYVLPAPV